MVNEPFSRSSRQKFTNFPVQVLSRCLLWDQPQDRLFDDIYFLFIFYLFSTLSLNTNLFILPWSHDSILSTSIFCSFSVLGRNSSVNKKFNWWMGNTLIEQYIYICRYYTRVPCRWWKERVVNSIKGDTKRGRENTQYIYVKWDVGNKQTTLLGVELHLAVFDGRWKREAKIDFQQEDIFLFISSVNILMLRCCRRNNQNLVWACFKSICILNFPSIRIVFPTYPLTVLRATCSESSSESFVHFFVDQAVCRCGGNHHPNFRVNKLDRGEWPRFGCLHPVNCPCRSIARSFSVVYLLVYSGFFFVPDLAPELLHIWAKIPILIQFPTDVTFSAFGWAGILYRTHVGHFLPFRNIS